MTPMQYQMKPRELGCSKVKVGFVNFQCNYLCSYLIELNFVQTQYAKGVCLVSALVGIQDGTLWVIPPALIVAGVGGGGGGIISIGN